MNIYHLKEKIPHGTEHFPFEIHHPTGLMAAYHWHDECEFIYIISGNATVKIGTEQGDYKHGDCLYIPPNELHAIFPDNPHDFDFYAILFHPRWLVASDDICSQYLSQNYAIQSLYEDDPIGKPVIDHIRAVCQLFNTQPIAYELRIKAKLLELFSYIYEHELFTLEPNSNENSDIKRFKATIHYIQTHWDQSISINELACVCGYSPSHFSRFFKHMSGKSPIEYINRQRVYHACDMLEASDRKILDIALDCGFLHIGHFIKTFSKYMDCTPNQYRKKKSMGSSI